MNASSYSILPFAIMLPCLPATASTQTEGLFIAHLDNVLGTSFDLKLIASSYTVARQAEKVALAEIERLTNILSSYRPDSEFSQWASTLGQAVPVSADLLAVLGQFDYWHQQTNGAIQAAAEAINQCWQQAGRSQMHPSKAHLAQLVADVQQQHWQLNPTSQTATRLTETPLRLHTFTKGYILDRATEKVLTIPGIRAAVLNIGGDLVARGDWTESVRITDPRADAENDLPVARITVQNRAVATSGDYRRGVWVGDTWYSHIVDPRTGQPAREVISATVVHPDASTAGALATAFTILPPADSAQLAASIPDTDYLIVTQDGQQQTSPGWNQLIQPASIAPATSPIETIQLMSVASYRDKLWNPNQELLISFELSQLEGRYHRPFVAVWVEDENHNPVRQIALWYNKPRWLPELRAWYSQQRSSGFDASSIASATRSAGAYSLKWDGKNDQGEYVKQGKYTICIEAAREHGTYQLIRQEMDFNGKLKQQTIAGNVEIATAALDYRQIAR